MGHPSLWKQNLAGEKPGSLKEALRMGSWSPKEVGMSGCSLSVTVTTIRQGPGLGQSQDGVGSTGSWHPTCSLLAAGLWPLPWGGTLAPRQWLACCT